jgi:ketosteroid isomerase-like protein
MEMPQNSVAVLGRHSVKASYERIFATIKLKVTFTIHEIVQLGEDLAYGRTTSEGKQEILATRVQSNEANNELFIFRNEEEGQWKIHRYLFDTSNPLPPPVGKASARK